MTTISNALIVRLQQQLDRALDPLQLDLGPARSDALAAIANEIYDQAGHSIAHQLVGALGGETRDIDPGPGRVGHEVLRQRLAEIADLALEVAEGVAVQ